MLTRDKRLFILWEQFCKLRNDDWAFTVRGRVEFFGGDLHAADCVYHKSCNINFRTFRDIRRQHRLAPESKRKKVGRPTRPNSDQEQAFYKMYTYFEENYEKQLTITDLSNKMKELRQPVFEVEVAKTLRGFYICG